MEDRLLNILSHYQLTPSQFADKIGVQRSSISHLLSGRNKPSFDFLSRMTEKFSELNIDWFITGQGTMLKKPIQGAVNLSLFDMEKVTPTNYSEPSVKQDIADQKTTNDDRFTNVKSELEPNRKGVSKIILFYHDKSWEEFLPSDI